MSRRRSEPLEPDAISIWRKTLQTDLGPVEIRSPRDRDGSSEPKLVGKR